MEVGIFTPIGNNGWLISENSPQYMPSFDLNKEIAQKAESYGVDFLLSMIKLRGFGGKTEFWEYNLESFTLMAGLAAVTEKIKIYATCPTLVIPPAFCARMCNTIDSISASEAPATLSAIACEQVQGTSMSSFAASASSGTAISPSRSST